MAEIVAEKQLIALGTRNAQHRRGNSWRSPPFQTNLMRPLRTRPRKLLQRLLSAPRNEPRTTVRAIESQRPVIFPVDPRSRQMKRLTVRIPEQFVLIEH